MQAAQQIETLVALRAWLQKAQIDLSAWGEAGHKSVENLWQEVRNGESVLQDSPPRRVVRAILLIIRQDDKILVEGTQRFGDGQQRYRGTPPAEKLKPDETPREGARRGLQEELGVTAEEINIVTVSPTPHRTMRESASYPGLKTEYLFYRVEAAIENLPQSEFWTTERSDNASDPVQQHQWLWVDEDNVSPLES